MDPGFLVCLLVVLTVANSEDESEDKKFDYGFSSDEEEESS